MTEIERTPEDVSGDYAFDLDYHLSDMGNTERLISHYGGMLRYSFTRKKWVIWNGRFWEWDDGAKISFLAKQTVKGIYGEAGDTEDSNRRQDLAKHALKSESDRAISAMIELAKTELGIPIDLNKLDSDIWLLNCKNGTVNLMLGELQEFSSQDYLTRGIGVNFDPEAKCPTWLKFLEDVTGCDNALQGYLQRAVGYSLTGDCRNQVLFFLYGLGNNGKSTFLSVIRKILGEYAQRAATDTFLMKDKNTGPQESLADLKGKRFVTASELEDGRKLAVSLVKDLTGGETIKADRKYEHQFEFLPTFKIWLSGNHKPTITDTTMSIWRRVKLIPFTVTINPEDIDDGLAAKLENESEGILAWAVAGCLQWSQVGLVEPEIITNATSQYRSDSDILHDFLDDICVIEDWGTVLKHDLREHYEDWAKDNHQDPVTQRTFRTRLIEKGITDFKGTAGKRYWKGVRISTEGDEKGVVA